MIFNKLESLDRNLDVSTVSTVGDFEKDSRMSLTMVYFLPEELKEKIQKNILEPLKRTDPFQYYYPLDALHITIQNVRVVADPPNFTEQDIDSLKKLASYMEIEEQGKLAIQLDGLFKMPTGISIKGYPNIHTQEFILKLRRKLLEIGVADDKKYLSPSIVINNTTLCRFYKPPNKEFLKTFEKIKNINLGNIYVDRISLVSTNAVCHKNKIKILAEFSIK